MIKEREDGNKATVGLSPWRRDTENSGKIVIDQAGGEQLGCMVNLFMCKPVRLFLLGFRSGRSRSVI